MESLPKRMSKEEEKNFRMRKKLHWRMHQELVLWRRPKWNQEIHQWIKGHYQKIKYKGNMNSWKHRRRSRISRNIHKIIKENFPHIGKEQRSQTQEWQKTWNRLSEVILTLTHNHQSLQLNIKKKNWNMHAKR